MSKHKTKQTDTEKINRINNIIKTAEEWATDQIMPEGSICISALKDIRRVVRS